MTKNAKLKFKYPLEEVWPVTWRAVIDCDTLAMMFSSTWWWLSGIKVQKGRTCNFSFIQTFRERR